MKKVIVIMLFVLSAIVGNSQITDTANLRSYINTNIIPNVTKSITATQMSSILNGYLNVMPWLFNKRYDSIYIAGGNLYLRRGGVTTNFPIQAVETDPVFNASAAKNVTNTFITNWNVAFGWGNHASAGYLTTINAIVAAGDLSGTYPNPTVAKLNGQLPAYYLSRSNHTGSQAISTVTGLQSALDTKLAVVVTTASSGQLIRYDGTNWVNWTPNFLTANQPITVTATGDATGTSSSSATSPSIALTLATVNSNVGTYNNVTVNAKGLVTAATNVSYLTANQTVTLSGDISGSGTTAITATIGANKVTLANMAQIATATFLGRTSASTGNVEALTVAQAKSLLNLTGTNSGDQTITLSGDATGSGTAGITVAVAKLNGQLPSYYLDRTNHTGSQTASTISDFSSAADARITLQKGAASGIAPLGSDSKVPTSYLPAIAQNGNTFVAASQAAMLALSGAVPGDFAVRTDQNKTFVLATAGPGTLSNWQELLTPTAPVQSVNGFTGVVSLTTTNIAEGTNLYYTNARVWNSLSATSPIFFNTSTGVISSQAATASVSGYLTSTDWSTFNNKLSANQAVTITATGDVSGTSSASGTAPAITLTIGANKVTLAQMAQVATATFLGRTTASTGNVEALTVAQVKALLNLSGTNSGDQTITLTGDVTGSGTGSFATAIGAGKVTNTMLAGGIDLTAKVTGLLPDGNISSASTWNAKQPALSGTGIVVSVAGTISYVSNNSTNWNTAYDRSGTSLSFSSSTFTFTKQDGTTLTVSVPTFNQNTTGNAATATVWNGRSWGGASGGSDTYFMTGDATTWYYSSVAQVQSRLGLGSNAYTSTAYLPIAGGSSYPITGSLYVDGALLSKGYYSLRNSGGSGLGHFIQAKTWVGSGTDATPSLASEAGLGLKIYTNGSGIAERTVWDYQGYITHNYSFYNNVVTNNTPLTGTPATDLVNGFALYANGGYWGIRTNSSHEVMWDVYNGGTAMTAMKIQQSGSVIHSYGYYTSSDYGFMVQDQGGYGVYLFGRNTLNFNQGLNADSDGWINYAGYGGGFSRSRNTRIGDGKGSCLVYVDGVNGQVGVNSGVQSLDSKFNVFNNSGTAYGLRINYAGTLNNYYDANHHYFRTATGTDILDIYSSGLTISGTATATGFFESSDTTLKKISKWTTSADGISAINFTWKDQRDLKQHIGYPAQEVITVLPDAVSKDSKGKLIVNYTEVHTYKIMQLEKRVAELENIILKNKSKG